MRESRYRDHGSLRPMANQRLLVVCRWMGRRRVGRAGRQERRRIDRLPAHLRLARAMPGVWRRSMTDRDLACPTRARQERLSATPTMHANRLRINSPKIISVMQAIASTSSCTPPAPSAFLPAHRSLRRSSNAPPSLACPPSRLADRNGLYGVGALSHRGEAVRRQGAHRRGDCRLILRQPAHAACLAAASVPGRAAAHHCCSAPRKPAIKISASSSRASRCAKPPRPKALQRSKISKNFPPD